MTYIFKIPDTPEYGEDIATLLNRVFHPQKVGDLARTFFNHLPGLENHHWFTMADASTGEPVSTFTLIPWTWEACGIRLKVAEMGLVGTLDTCRGKGMMKELNTHFDAHVKEHSYDLCIIQGIPGFYHNFGYHYAIALENHIDLPLALIPTHGTTAGTGGGFRFRRADHNDIGFLMGQDADYRNANTFSVFRSRAEWEYMLVRRPEIEYGSDFWIMEALDGTPMCYARVLFDGFGNGLILSEVSEGITHEGFAALAAFLKSMALAQEKPHIRLNLHPGSPAGQMALAMGAAQTRPYAWQIKIPDRVRLLDRLTPLLEKRLESSMFKNYTGKLRLNLYTETIDLEFIRGKIIVNQGNGSDAEQMFSIPKDLFGALVLGHRSWDDLQQCRPDIFPANQYLRFKPAVLPDEAGLLVDVLFPRTRSWIYERF